MESISRIRDYENTSSLFEAGKQLPENKETPQETPQNQSTEVQSDMTDFSDESEEMLAATNTTMSPKSEDVQREKAEIVQEYKKWYDDKKHQSKDKLVCDETQRDILKDMEKHFGGLDSLENWSIGPVYARKQPGGSYGHYATGIFDKEGKLDSILDPVPPRSSWTWVQDAPRVYSPSDWSRKWSSPIYGENDVLPDNKNPKRPHDKYFNDFSNDKEILHR